MKLLSKILNLPVTKSIPTLILVCWHSLSQPVIVLPCTPYQDKKKIAIIIWTTMLCMGAGPPSIWPNPRPFGVPRDSFRVIRLKLKYNCGTSLSLQCYLWCWVSSSHQITQEFKVVWTESILFQNRDISGVYLLIGCCYLCVLLPFPHPKMVHQSMWYIYCWCCSASPFLWWPHPLDSIELVGNLAAIYGFGVGVCGTASTISSAMGTTTKSSKFGKSSQST